MLSPFDLPEGAVLLVTDELPSPANFLLHQILAEHIKSTKGAAKNIVLSVSEDIAKWKSLAAKVVCPLSTAHPSPTQSLAEH